MSYESMVFYKSFYDAICGLEKELQAEIYDAIIYYGIYGEEKELSPMAKMAFALIKPQIDANNRRKEKGKKGADYGKLGGRPKKNNPTETPKEPQINPTETPNVNANVNVKVNDNVNVNVNANVKDNDNENVVSKDTKHIYGEYKHVRLTDTEYQKLCEEYGDIDTGRAIRYLDEYIEMKGAKYKSHYLAMRKWVYDAIKRNNPKPTSIQDEWEGIQ